VGIASLDDLGSKATPEQLITAADEALYRAKHEGRNSCQLFAHEES
jgi:PleD family two-component response regulator